MDERARATGVHAGIAALLLPAYGWGMGGFGDLSSAGAAYAAAIAVFNAMLKFGGIAMAITAAICLAGKRVGLVVDAVVAGLCGIIMVGCSLIWLATGGGIDFQDIMILIFGGLFISGARRSWADYQSAGGARAAVVARAVTPKDPEAPHPASIRPASLAGAEDTEPPEGYLAALSKEKDEPPTANFE